MAVSLLLFFLSALLVDEGVLGGREQYKMDFGWKFSMEPALPANASCLFNFTMNLDNQQCYNLNGIAVNSLEDCIEACCQDYTCEIYQWCPLNGTCANGVPGTCWLGPNTGCGDGAGWVSQGRNITGHCFFDFCQPTFDDSAWPVVQVPHDFVIYGNFSPNASMSHGYLPQGVGWYRKHFDAPSSLQGRSVWLYFDGVYRNSDTWLNGVFLGNHQSGYTSFFYDISTLLNFESENVLVVRADATQDEGWWYEGGGVYRHVWLYAADLLHVAPDAVAVSSVINDPIYSDGAGGQVGTSALVTVTLTIVNDRYASAQFRALAKLLTEDGHPISSAFVDATVGGQSAFPLTLAVSAFDVALWSPSSPSLFVVSVSLVEEGGVADQVNTTVGIRRVTFDPNEGLMVNEVPVKIKGVCNHQDFAGVGTAVPDSVNMFRIAALKDMGVNAWRMSHNPPNPELLDMADRMGMLVWDENRNFGDDPQYLVDVASMVTRDRNHPSVIIWSLCNEVGCMETANDSSALLLAQQFKAAITANDASRPVSAAWNADLADLEEGWGPLVLDVQGINYNYANLDPYHDMFPTIPVLSSETASCTCARGVYMPNYTACHESVFDADSCALTWWDADATRIFVSGGFAWTGFDYKGEPTPFSWPDINSNFGIHDIAGFRKDQFYYYQSWWQSDPVLHLFPHWNNPFPVENGGFGLLSCSVDSNETLIRFTGTGNEAGQIMSVTSGLCLNGTCADPSSGCVMLDFVPCDSGDSSLSFNFTNGLLQNAQNGACLTIWDSGTSTQVGLAECSSLVYQLWTVDQESNMISSSSNPSLCMSSVAGIPVIAYSNAVSVELFVNGASMGRQPVPYLGRAMWAVFYEPGVLSAAGYNISNEVIASATVATTGAPFSIVLSLDSPREILADGQDTALVRASIVDFDGNVVPDASNFISFSVDPAFGTIIGTGSGDPSSHESDKATSRTAFNGLARALVQSTVTSGSFYVSASSDGLQAGSIELSSVVPQFPWPNL